MTENEKNIHDWTSCPPGEMGRLVAGLRGKRRTRQTMVVGGTVAALAVLVLVGNAGIGRWEGHGVTCKHVSAVANEFVAGKLGADETEQVRLHLENCRRCREAIDKLRTEKAGHDLAGRTAPARQDAVSQTVAAL